MRSQIRSFTVAGRNAQDGISLVQTAEGALNEVSNQLGRLRELAIQASNGTLTDTDRTTLNAEYQALKGEITRISSETEFNGVSLLDGASSLNIQVGLDSGDAIAVNTVDVGTVQTNLGGIDGADATNALTELDLIDTEIEAISTARGALGASQNRLQSAFASIQSARENLSAAESRIRDVDVAAETADLTRNSILQQAAVSVLTQANTQPQIALSLLQG